MPATALALALAAAVFHALWNLLLARAPDVQSATAVALVTAELVFAPLAIVVWHADAGVWPWLVASGAFELVYFTLLAGAYRRAPLSVVYPVARGSAPVLVLLVAWSAGFRQVAGVLLVASGVLLVRGLRHPDRRGVAFGVVIAVCIASYTLVDKEGLGHAAPVPYLELVLLPIAVVALPTYLWRRGVRPFTAQLTWPTLGAAVGSFAAYVLFLFALRLTAAPGVAAVRETSVVIGAALAAVFLHEHVTWARFAGAAAVAGGVAILAVA